MKKLMSVAMVGLLSFGVMSSDPTLFTKQASVKLPSGNVFPKSQVPVPKYNCYISGGGIKCDVTY